MSWKKWSWLRMKVAQWTMTLRRVQGGKLVKQVELLHAGVEAAPPRGNPWHAPVAAQPVDHLPAAAQPLVAPLPATPAAPAAAPLPDAPRRRARGPGLPGAPGRDGVGHKPCGGSCCGEHCSSGGKLRR